MNAGTALVAFGLLFLVVFTGIATGVSSSLFRYLSRVIENLSSFVLRVHWSVLAQSLMDRLVGWGGRGKKMIGKDAEQKRG
ncbi:MAG: hypothetical protein PHS73_03495 [Candidatus Peribacteraceae bacterium]|nr:hypothetical protein [Candidatus Peribacteraceae bacterium]